MNVIQTLPKRIRKDVIHSELQNESPIIWFLRSFLGYITASYVVTYKRDIFLKDIPAKYHLCGNIEGADLNTAQLKVLKICEKIVKRKNASFAVYKKPIELISPPCLPGV